MKPITVLSSLIGLALAGVVAYLARAAADVPAASTSLAKVPPGYRDWKFVSIAREDAPLDDIRVILGNDTAIAAYRAAKQPFPEGTIIARLAYTYDVSQENNVAFGHSQSHVAGLPKNGVQFMMKDSKAYANTGGWAFAQFDDGKLVDKAMLQTCFPCHQAAHARDFVFTRYAP